MDPLEHDTGDLSIVNDVSSALQTMQLAGRSERVGSERFENNSPKPTLRMTSRQLSWNSMPDTYSDEFRDIFDGSLDLSLQAETTPYLDQDGSTESRPLPMRPSSPTPLGHSTIPINTHEVDHLEVPATGAIESESMDLLARPGTADSTEIEKQANTAFDGFDGVHFVAGEGIQLSERPGEELFSSEAPSLHENDQPSDQAMVGDNMVYYPAPVPMMLNMPSRLASKLPSAEFREDRRSLVIDTMHSPAKELTGWLPGSSEEESIKQGMRGQGGSSPRRSIDPRRSAGNPASLPPQLRASVFFEQAPTSHEVEIREQSATATLESILDASKHAPVSAFTDHPFAGHIGPELYRAAESRGNSRDGAASDYHSRRSVASLSALNSQQSTSNSASKGVRSISTSVLPRIELPTSEDTNNQTYQTEDLSRRETEDGGKTPIPELAVEAASEAGGGSNERVHFRGNERYAQPTTLMAELRLRKEQQRHRNMTAATAYPSGLHRTLLEIDTVAEAQKLSRKNKRIALAWEDPHGLDEAADVDVDEEVPLGMLFPGVKNHALVEGRPLGLIEKRFLEDSEPLSRRRERLKGGLQRPGMSRHTTAMESAYRLDFREVNGAGEVEREGEDETLAQRARRLRAGVQRTPDSGQRSSLQSTKDLSSQVHAGNHPGEEQEVVETLGQRKRRLQLESRSQSHGESGKIHNHSEGPFLGPDPSITNLPYENPGASYLQTQSQSPSHFNLDTNGSQQNLQASNNHSQLAWNSVFTDFSHSRNSWVPNSTGHPSNKHIARGSLGFSKSAQDLSFPRRNMADAFPRSTTMTIPSGLGMGGAGTNSVFSGAVPPLASASLGAQQREMIDRWRLSIMP